MLLRHWSPIKTLFDILLKYHRKHNNKINNQKTNRWSKVKHVTTSDTFAEEYTVMVKAVDADVAIGTMGHAFGYVDVALFTEKHFLYLTIFSGSFDCFIFSFAWFKCLRHCFFELCCFCWSWRTTFNIIRHHFLHFLFFISFKLLLRIKQISFFLNSRIS